MSENHLNDPNMTQETTENEEVSDALAQAENSPSDSGNELLHTSLEDTGESSLLQEQEARVTQNNGMERAAKAAPNVASKDAVGSNAAVERELRNYAHAMNEYLTWKENLRITSVDAQIGGPYFDLWTKEANLFFRRLVILRKRIESIKKQQRA